MPVSAVIILPRTVAGRDLLRLVLPFAETTGTLPDGSSIYETDFDAIAVEVDQMNAGYEAWHRQNRERR